MSHQQIDRSPDLKHLRDDGYDLEIKQSHLLVHSVPYVNAKREVKRGTLVSELSMTGSDTTKPGTHVAHWIGEFPCKSDGSDLGFRHPDGKQAIGNGIENDHSFSLKSNRKEYDNYYDKAVTYVTMIENEARLIDPTATAKTFRPAATTEDESPFKYYDTATSRAGIGTAAEKLLIPKVGIVGIGGTGSYVLDFLAKAPIREIHLFDGDVFLNHNAFRAPGAASLSELEAKPKKVDYFAQKYSQMRWKIIPHPDNITESTVELLRDMSFVFICIDGGPQKRLLVDHLERWNTPFIDTGMGVELVGGKLRGTLAVTESLPENRDTARKAISFIDTSVENEYQSNIQIVELNALNAALAVIRWKKSCGFYHDLQRERSCTYTITGNKDIP